MFNLLSFISVFLLIGCNSSIPVGQAEEEQLLIEEATTPLPPSLNGEGMRELSTANINQDSTAGFPGCDYYRAVVFELNGRPGPGADAVFRLRTGKQKELSEAELESFLELISNPDSYGDFTAACHDPRIGLVFYDEEGEVCSYLSLCLACNNLYTEPSLNLNLEPARETGFSKAMRKQLRDIFAEWGFPDNNHSEMFDD